MLKDTANVVQYTSKEENLHAEGGMALINQIRAEHVQSCLTQTLETRIWEAEVALDAEHKLD